MDKAQNIKMDENQCLGCVSCDYLTFSTDLLEKHCEVVHQEMLPKFSRIIISLPQSVRIRESDALFYSLLTDQSSGAYGKKKEAYFQCKTEEMSKIAIKGEKQDSCKAEKQCQEGKGEDQKCIDARSAFLSEQLAKKIYEDFVSNQRGTHKKSFTHYVGSCVERSQFQDAQTRMKTENDLKSEMFLFQETYLIDSKEELLSAKTQEQHSPSKNNTLPVTVTVKKEQPYLP